MPVDGLVCGFDLLPRERRDRLRGGPGRVHVSDPRSARLTPGDPGLARGLREEILRCPSRPLQRSLHPVPVGDRLLPHQL